MGLWESLCAGMSACSDPRLYSQRGSWALLCFSVLAGLLTQARSGDPPSIPPVLVFKLWILLVQ